MMDGSSVVWKVQCDHCKALLSGYSTQPRTRLEAKMTAQDMGWRVWLCGPAICPECTEVTK